MKAFRAAQLDTETRLIAFGILRALCGKIGYLPESYLLPDKFDISGPPLTSGGCADIRMGVFRGEAVAVKSMMVSEMDDKARIRKVEIQAISPHPGLLTHDTAFL